MCDGALIHEAQQIQVCRCSHVLSCLWSLRVVMGAVQVEVVLVAMLVVMLECGSFRSQAELLKQLQGAAAVVQRGHQAVQRDMQRPP